MSLERRRYQIAPQMRDYDKIKLVYLPYIMQFQEPLLKLQSVSTDRNGFRLSIYKDERLNHSDFLKRRKSLGIFTGSSIAFGYGASSDKYTIPSIFNRSSNSSIWFNYSGIALNSTQELLVFLLFLPKKVNKVIIVSGLINYSIPTYRSSYTSTLFTPYYAELKFEKRMKPNAAEYRSNPSMSFKELITKDFSYVFSDIVESFQRDMNLWKSLSNSMGFELYFALQPCQPWIDKKLTNEEKELIEIWDSHARYGHNRRMGLDLACKEEYRKEYCEKLESICDKLNIPFLNLNSEDLLSTNEWIFFDRIHLTDRGNEIVAQILTEKFNLTG